MAKGAWRLTERDVQEIRTLINVGHYTDGQIAEKYKVSRVHIWKIRHQQRWAWVDTPKLLSGFKSKKQIDKVIIVYKDGTKLEF